MHLLEALAIEAGVTPEQAGLVVTGALRRLHRFSVVDPAGLGAVILECRLEIGKEACWHLVGLLENQRVNHSEPWPDMLVGFDRDMRVFGVLIEKWRAAGSADGGTEA